MNEVVICSSCNLVRSECECAPSAWEDLPNDRKPRHSSASVEHFTPPAIVEAARQVLGWRPKEPLIDVLEQFDLDPASCELANRLVVRAKTFYGIEDNSLNRPWNGSVFLNPPGGIVKDKESPNYRKSQALVFWKKLQEEYQANRVTDAFFVAFSLELLQSSQQFLPELMSMADYAFCIPSSRLRFWAPDGNGGLYEQKDPTHANAIVYLPKGNDVEERVQRIRCFKQHFLQFGVVVGGY